MHRFIRARRLEELEQLHDRYPQLERCSSDGALSFEGVVSSAHGEHRVRLTLPSAYPGVPPIVHELDLETGAPVPDAGRPRRIGAHGICLFPHGDDPQAWRPETGRAADALDRFREFIVEERASFRAFRSPVQLIIPPRVVDSMLDEPAGVLEFSCVPGSAQLFASGVFFPHEQESLYPIEELPPKWRELTTQQTLVPWLRLNTDEAWGRLVGSRAQLDATLRASASAERYQLLSECPRMLLVRQSPVGCDERVDLCCVAHGTDADTVLWAEVVRSTAEDLLFNRVDQAMAGRAALAKETVVIVGLGSLGSMTAKALAQAGVSRFVLIDPDALVVENVSRHVGGVGDIGRPKVDVVEDAILATNPTARVDKLERWLAWDLDYMSAGRELEALLDGGESCTIVSTCANGMTEAELNTLAVERSAPAVYAAALGAAEHGRIFRVIPGESPCLQCILIAQDERPEHFPRYIAPHLPGERSPPYLLPGLPGLALDIAQIALLTARLTLQTIARVRGIELQLPPAGGDHLLWTNRGDWGFDHPLQLRIEDFPKDPICPVCGAAATEEPLSPEQERQLAVLERQFEAGAR